jgi:hypothetical protein
MPPPVSECFGQSKPTSDFASSKRGRDEDIQSRDGPSKRPKIEAPLPWQPNKMPAPPPPGSRDPRNMLGKRSREEESPCSTEPHKRSRAFGEAILPAKPREPNLPPQDMVGKRKRGAHDQPGARPKAIKTEEQARFNCCACNDEVGDDKRYYTAPCGHNYCFICLRQLVRSSLVDGSTYPPRCCQLVIPMINVKNLLGTELASEVHRRERRG